MNQLSNNVTIIALANGMIGGTILVLPLIALKTGYLLIPIVSFISGLTSFFTAYLTLKHTANYKSVQSAIYNHFNRKSIYVTVYNAVIVISFMPILILYFNLLTEQWEGVLELKSIEQSSFKQKMHVFLPYIIAITLLFLTSLMNRLQLGPSLLGYGIISVIGYVIFMVWVQWTAPQHFEDPSTNQIIRKSIPASGKQFIDMAAALGMGYSIHNFMIPVLKKNPKTQQHSKLLLTAYLIGFGVYTFIAYGCFGIINRKSIVEYPETIVDYFRNQDGSSSWEVITIQVLYIIHLLSAFPQFLISMKNRFFSIFSQNSLQSLNSQQQVKQKESSLLQHIFFIIFIGICLTIRILGIKIRIIIEINGAVIAFIYVFFGPIFVHIKCLYLSNSYKQLNQQNTIECICQIQNNNKSLFEKLITLFLVLLSISIGLFVMVYTLYSLYNGRK